MAANPPPTNPSWAGEPLVVGSHVCLYYGDEATLHKSLAFVRDGLDRPHEFGVIFADESRFQELLAWLQEGYLGDLSALQQSGKLALIGGQPTLTELVSSIGARLDQAVADGHTLIRFLGFIAWGAPGWPDENTLLEFESRVNEVVTAYPAVIVCTYGVPRLSGRQLIKGGLQTHPVTILDGVVAANPHYVPTESYLARLKAGD
jgi:hypothetical protein